ncbi:MAG: response regulator transcription factor [Candidatus Bipolaricaulia bacterium]
MKILVAEDDPGARKLLRKFLTAEGHQVITAEDGLEAIERFFTGSPDLVLLDLMMPKVDGWEVLERIRNASETPVIMLTVRGATEDKVRGLSAGVDDYITKPFDLREVAARIEAVMRRYRGEGRDEAGESVLELGDLVIDDASKEVRVRGQLVGLSPKEYELLKLLASKPGRVFSNEEILEAVWPERGYASAEDVKKYVYLLRNKVEVNTEQPELIVTVRGFGYKLAV